MSESEQAGPVVFRVVDRARGLHVIRANHMVNDGSVVRFLNDRNAEVACFIGPLGAMRVEGSVSVPAPTVTELMPGEACLASFPPAPRGLVAATCVVAVAIAVSVALKGYELFWFAG